uniref:Uncharacterized protein n=1 Tax=Timema douglasi TaxID=61478 RepID=A0A7R8Z6Q4_TIMDO|nr:unnamed protein product [Timema douglasi]
MSVTSLTMQPLKRVLVWINAVLVIWTQEEEVLQNGSEVTVEEVSLPKSPEADTTLAEEIKSAGDEKEAEKEGEKSVKKEKEKKDKVKKKWSFRSISFSKKDKSKPARDEGKNGDLSKEGATAEPLTEIEARVVLDVGLVLPWLPPRLGPARLLPRAGVTNGTPFIVPEKLIAPGDIERGEYMNLGVGRMSVGNSYGIAVPFSPSVRVTLPHLHLPPSLPLSHSSGVYTQTRASVFGYLPENYRNFSLWGVTLSSSGTEGGCTLASRLELASSGSINALVDLFSLFHVVDHVTSLQQLP